MPRLSNSTILKAHQQHPLLPLLLRECRSPDSAKNELRWLQEKANRLISFKKATRSTHAPLGWRRLLNSMCHTRSRGMPLQYILGDQPFGDLEILCQRGVLIPRAETETFTIHTAKLILDSIRGQCRESEQERCLRIVDLCTGSGCIALLLHGLLAPYIHRLSILGIDLSPTAIGLAKKNLAHNIQLGLLSKRATTEIAFQRGNVLTYNDSELGVQEVIRNFQWLPSDLQSHCDVLISNPPYISPESFRDGTTSRSVRAFEPKLALVPSLDTSTIALGIENQEDLFYYHIILLSFKLCAKLVVLECGSRSQAGRVATITRALISGYRPNTLVSIEIWPSTGTVTNGDICCEDDPCVVVLRE
ncbi:S-adenosyl-L-methionine-dependent methyltransferase [Aspergillus coremiiformis]|uniref:S-adenosyl-L-methionine-dependent methyltransferase n=1 Tax=Aspergillus coremiiformis TaxID=138285 RepID=A0A5N6YS54_9EURO|nr:S-adenosyl-L-methionine-dependent methyltransferase [Aspergillus coremiiformis]